MLKLPVWLKTVNMPSPTYCNSMASTAVPPIEPPVPAVVVAVEVLQVFHPVATILLPSAEEATCAQSRLESRNVQLTPLSLEV
jgi:hypothetical protein